MDVKKTALTTAATTAIGAGAGYLAGAKKAGAMLANQGITKGMSFDEFKSNGIKNFIKNDADYKNFNLHQKINVKTHLEKSLKTTFDSALKAAKNTKIKWVAGIAAAGLAIGVATSAIISKISAKKAESAEQ